MWRSWWTGFDARDPNSHGGRLVPARYGEKIPVVVRAPALQRATGGVLRWSAVCVCLTLAPDMLFRAPHLYRSNFKPSARLENHTRWCASILSPPTATATLGISVYLNAASSEAAPAKPATADPNMDQFWSPSEQYGVQQALSMSLVGDKAKGKGPRLAVDPAQPTPMRLYQRAD